jgi:predicted alpha/beta-hydrolase family hydrolase
MATMTGGQEVALPVGDRETAGWWHPVDGALAAAVVAPGAGNSVQERYFDGIVAGLAGERVAAFRFDFVYGHLGRKSPDPPAVLLEAWRSAVARSSELGGGLPLVATGKSMGGRYASMLAAEEGSAFLPRGLVFFGYPLHAPGTPEKQRSEHLFDVAVPMLFIEGTRDPFARRDLLEPTLERLGRRARVEWIEGGDHSHRVRGVRRSDTEIGEDLGRRAGAFTRDVLEGGA